jgi:hypothetical protein
MTTQYKRTGYAKNKDRLLAIGQAHANLSPKPTDTCLFYSLDTHCQITEDNEYEAYVDVVWIEPQPQPQEKEKNV